MNTKIGTDIPSDEFWKTRTEEYVESLRGPYHEHRLNVVKALISDVTLQGTHCLDVGCGEGVFAEHLLNHEASVLGFDSSGIMVEHAKHRLMGFADKVDIVEGGILCMEDIGSKSIDAVFALNVLAYLTPDEERCFYENSARILRPDGILVVTHSNELFDMFTLNRFTVDFFHRNFSVNGLSCDIETLLRRPVEPSRNTFAVRENPLAYKYKLAFYGFVETAQEFVNFHPLPPLLMPLRDPDDINAHYYRETVGWSDSERWKLMFMCSMFASRSILNQGS